MSEALLDGLVEAASFSDPARRARRTWAAFMSADPHESLAEGLKVAAAEGLVAPHAMERLVLQHEARRETSLWVEPCSGVEMIWVPPGRAASGEGQPVGEMLGFSLARHPVTEAQWRLFCEATGHPFGRARSHDQRPVTAVTQADAIAWCQWAGLNLPTEWMWERAARGDELRTYPWGSRWPSPALCHIQATEPTDIGSFPRTRTVFGCQDLIGNVSERCLDSDGDAMALPCLRRAHTPDSVPVRGSAWIRSDAQRERMSGAHRRRLGAETRNTWCGFRPAFSWVLDG